MAHDVTSEWDDIHRKLGNYELLPEQITETECTNENIKNLEEITKNQIQKKAEKIVNKEFMKG